MSGDGFGCNQARRRETLTVRASRGRGRARGRSRGLSGGGWSRSAASSGNWTTGRGWWVRATDGSKSRSRIAIGDHVFAIEGDGVTSRLVGTLSQVVPALRASRFSRAVVLTAVEAKGTGKALVEVFDLFRGNLAIFERLESIQERHGSARTRAGRWSRG